MISLKIASKRLKNMDFSLYLRLSLSVKCHHFLKTDITLHTYTTLLILAMAVCACSCHSSKQTQQTQLTEIPAPVDGITETPAPIKPGTTIDVPEYSVISRLTVPICIMSRCRSHPLAMLSFTYRPRQPSSPNQCGLQMDTGWRPSR